MNEVVLTGRIANELELRKTQSNKSVCEFNLAVNRNYSEGVDFLRIHCWNQNAEYLNQYARKGTLIAVKGRIETSSYEKDGQTINKTYIVSDNVEILRQPENKDNNSNFGGKRAGSEKSVNIEPDELPFY